MSWSERNCKNECIWYVRGFVLCCDNRSTGKQHHSCHLSSRIAGMIRTGLVIEGKHQGRKKKRQLQVCFLSFLTSLSSLYFSLLLFSSLWRPLSLSLHNFLSPLSPWLSRLFPTLSLLLSLLSPLSLLVLKWHTVLWPYCAGRVVLMVWVLFLFLIFVVVQFQNGVRVHFRKPSLVCSRNARVSCDTGHFWRQAFLMLRLSVCLSLLIFIALIIFTSLLSLFSLFSPLLTLSLFCFCSLMPLSCLFPFPSLFYAKTWLSLDFWNSRW